MVLQVVFTVQHAWMYVDNVASPESFARQVSKIDEMPPGEKKNRDRREWVVRKKKKR